MNGDFLSRFRWGLLVGLLLTLGIIVKDIWLGTFDGLGSAKVVTLLLSMLIAALLWAWIAGRFGRNDDA